jgi:hypothetical protein
LFNKRTAVLLNYSLPLLSPPRALQQQDRLETPYLTVHLLSAAEFRRNITLTVTNDIWVGLATNSAAIMTIGEFVAPDRLSDC